MTDGSPQPHATAPAHRQCSAEEYASDGLPDLLLAGFFLVFGIEEMLGHEVDIFMPLALTTLFVSFFVARHFITQRRIGAPPMRDRALRCAAVASTAVGAFGAILVLLFILEPGETGGQREGVALTGWIIGGAIAVALLEDRVPGQRVGRVGGERDLVGALDLLCGRSRRHLEGLVVVLLRERLHARTSAGRPAAAGDRGVMSLRAMRAR